MKYRRCEGVAVYVTADFCYDTIR